MSDLLYLDTARLGRMSPSARVAVECFSQFASEHGTSLYMTEFLRHGAGSLPEDLLGRWPGLEKWNGVTSLKDQLRNLAEARPDSEVRLATRSASLMKFAARLLSAPCRNVLITDMTWPRYETILRRTQQLVNCRVTKIALRQSIVRGIDESRLVDEVSRQFASNGCDGLFAPLVDELGVQLPIARIVERIRSECELRFVVVDGAQAIGQVPLALASDYCDFLFAGTHKWLRAFVPMGIGFFGRPMSRDYIKDSLARWANQGIVDDPLLTFSEELSGNPRPAEETVAVTPMIAASGATTDALACNRESNPDRSLDRIAQIATLHNWKAIATTKSLCSRIRLFQSPDHSPLESLREPFFKHGIALTAYRQGVVRVSAPDTSVTHSHVDSLNNAFAK